MLLTRERSLEWNQCLVVGLAEAEPLVADMVGHLFNHHIDHRYHKQSKDNLLRSAILTGASTGTCASTTLSPTRTGPVMLTGSSTPALDFFTIFSIRNFNQSAISTQRASNWSWPFGYLHSDSDARAWIFPMNEKNITAALNMANKTKIFAFF